MAKSEVKVLIKIQGQNDIIEGSLDMTNRHDVDNWMMGRRFLNVNVPDPRLKNVYEGTIVCKLGPDLGKTAQIMFME